jgi:hypothetical protein
MAARTGRSRYLLGGSVPDAPTAVTSITKDAGATVSFRSPTNVGGGPLTHYVVTPYIGGSPQSTTTVTVGSAGSITGSDGNTYRQVNVTGLTNSTAYTFTVKARNSFGDSAESAASGANTPLSGLVFGDDFNGSADGPIDPEWWIYDRCGYLAQNEVQFYKPSHCVLDGSGNLKITAENISTSGPRYPSDPSFPGTINQPWRSGACQSNTKTWAPAAGNTMSFESRFQVCPDAGQTMWPGFFWLEGQLYLNAWKTDPLQEGWNSTDKAEIDIAEWFQTGDVSDYGNVSWAGTNELHNVTTAIDFSAAMHIFRCEWKPGVTVRFYRDGGLTYTSTVQIPDSGAQFMLLLYLQILSGAASSPQSCFVDYVRVYDQNLG